MDCDSWFDRRIFDSRFSRFFVNPKFKGYRFYVIIIIIVVIRWCDVLDHDDRRETDTQRRSMTDEESLHDYATRKLVTKFCDKFRPSFFVPGRALVAAAVRCSLKSNLDLGQD